MLPRIIAQTAAGFVLQATCLFVPAGTLDWPQAWAFLGLFAASGLAIGVWLLRTDPALLEERLRSPIGADQRTRDQIIMAATLLTYIGWLVFMGLDERFDWSEVPGLIQAVGAGLIVAGFWGMARVLRANSFASVTVRVQGERGQTIVTDGPYAITRHPMYGCGLVLMTGAPLLLDSVWGLALLPLLTALLAARTLNEEAVLMAGLTGYRDYASKVRFRLVPGVW